MGGCGCGCSCGCGGHVCFVAGLYSARYGTTKITTLPSNNLHRLMDEQVHWKRHSADRKLQVSNVLHVCFDRFRDFALNNKLAENELGTLGKATGQYVLLLRGRFVAINAIIVLHAVVSGSRLHDQPSNQKMRMNIPYCTVQKVHDAY